MTDLSQREAASTWGLGRITIQRAIKAGKLSLTPNKKIDVAEMVRVFGEPKPARHGVSEPLVASPEPPRSAGVDPKDARIAELQATVTAQAKHIESLDRAMQLLGVDRDRPKRRWWQRS